VKGNEQADSEQPVAAKTDEKQTTFNKVKNVKPDYTKLAIKSEYSSNNH